MTSPSTSGLPEISARLQQLIHRLNKRLEQLDESTLSYKPAPEKWSGKEVLGHLIDSAQNNLRRFITAQYEAVPPHIVYNQDFWVSANDYQRMPKQDLILLWKLLNERIVSVLKTMPPSAAEKLCNTGKGKEELHNIRFLADDYVAHLLHHMGQISAT